MRGAVLLAKTHTAASYRLYALPGGPPFRPGMVKVTEGGEAIEVEVWSVPAEHFGSFVAGIPSPLGIGKVLLAEGRLVSGFVCESLGVRRAGHYRAQGLESLSRQPLTRELQSGGAGDRS